MSEKSLKTGRYVLGLYLLIGGLISLYFVLTELGVFGFLYSLLPAIVTVVVISFFILSGWKYAFSRSKSGVTMMKASLWIQAIQLVFLGLGFKNYFGPYIAIGFTDTPGLKFQLLFEPFTYWFANGLNKLSDEVSIVFNLVAMGLLFLVYWIEKEETKISSEIDEFELDYKPKAK